MWIKCNACGYGIRVTRQHGVGLGDYGRCTVCGGRMTRSATRPLRSESKTCYRELCNAPVEGTTCSDGHEQPPH